MTITVGLPRGLLYYYYGTIWERFFRFLGAEVLVSGDTTKEMLDRGNILDEICMPVKIYFGHVMEIYRDVDFLFVPRVVSVKEQDYSCPKLIGLPDMLRSTVKGLPPLIDVSVNMRQSRQGIYKAVVQTGRFIGVNSFQSLYAWSRACRGKSSGMLAAAKPGMPNIALIGHPYIIQDRQASLNILEKLIKLDVRVITPDMVPKRLAERGADRLNKALYWTYCRHIAGAAIALADGENPVDGMIFITSFSCGPDSLVGEIVKHYAKEKSIPFMLLSVDEHTAEAGIITRLEAFTDMIKRRICL